MSSSASRLPSRLALISPATSGLCGVRRRRSPCCTGRGYLSMAAPLAGQVSWAERGGQQRASSRGPATASTRSPSPPLRRGADGSDRRAAAASRRRDDGDRDQGAATGGVQGRHQAALGAEGKPVGGILHVAPDDDPTVRRLGGGPHPQPEYGASARPAASPAATRSRYQSITTLAPPAAERQPAPRRHDIRLGGARCAGAAIWLVRLDDGRVSIWQRRSSDCLVASPDGGTRSNLRASRGGADGVLRARRDLCAGRPDRRQVRGPDHRLPPADRLPRGNSAC